VKKCPDPRATVGEQIKQLERQIATAIGEHPDGEIFLSLFKGTVITAAELLAEVGDCRAATQPATRSPATPARPRSPKSPANARPQRSAGGATSGCAVRSTPWLTAPATGTPGRRISTPKPAPAATITRARYAPSAAPGPPSCGVAGKRACPTTRPATAPCNDTSQSPSPPRRAPRRPRCHPADGRRSSHPEGRPAGPSAKRLTASRHR
jgi:hypothetical protein